MANPATAIAFPQAMDPKDTRAFYFILNQGDPNGTPSPLLELGEGVASYALATSFEASGVGLMILDDDAHKSQLGRWDETSGFVPGPGNLIRFFLSVDQAMWGIASFVTGILVGIEAIVSPTSSPSSDKKCTGLVRIVNR